ncbi:hypothetical protein [Nannocystis punicea]|uniref:VWFA domain-containing protein n=1 Tax=Nannocystis punicea TaxID=2995304 RepID=A0ABY7GYK6_9BACT|nr:hypothetical protein [Nannocystis poenicansa]WAS92069.1 hypothetical protein O0S08_38295 [Nannocystis poenicansa]
MLRAAALVTLASLALSGCSDDGGRRDSATAAIISGVGSLPATTDEATSTTAPTTGEATGTTALTTGDDGSSAPDPSGAGPKFDIGKTPDAGPPPEPKACLKVDLLFVVDNSSSMKDEQDNLVASFPGFVQEIQQQLVDAESLHIGVVSTDKYEGNENPCDGVLGGLITQTDGSNSSNAYCGPYVSGKRYMTEQDDLGTRFSCAAQVGTSGDSNEKPLQAALRALGSELGQPGACNEGFVRQDALLVLVVITDEEEDGSSGDPPDWFNELVALKGGIETNIVTLALIGPENPECASAAEVAHRIIDFAEMFTYGSIGQICADSFQPFFHDAIAVIDQACENFVPPG